MSTPARIPPRTPSRASGTFTASCRFGSPDRCHSSCANASKSPALPPKTRYTVERATPALRAISPTLGGVDGSSRRHSWTPSRMRRRVSAADSARAFCSYARVMICELYHFHLTACLVDVGWALNTTGCPMKGLAGMAPQEVDVLVVGAGPAGLTAAATLRRYGAEVLVLERKARLSAHPRATVVSTRSMELLRSWGLEEKIRAGGMPDVEWLRPVTQT